MPDSTVAYVVVIDTYGGCDGDDSVETVGIYLSNIKAESKKAEINMLLSDKRSRRCHIVEIPLDTELTRKTLESLEW